MTANLAFSRTLSALADEHRLARTTITRATGVDSGNLSRILKGRQPPGRKFAPKLIALFKNPADRRKLVHAYFLDLAVELGIDAADVPAPSRREQQRDLADEIDASLYKQIRELALHASHHPELRTLLEDLAQVWASRQRPSVKPPAKRPPVDRGTLKPGVERLITRKKRRGPSSKRRAQ